MADVATTTNNDGGEYQDRLVLVEWVDPWSRGGWIDREEALREAALRDLTCRTVGWVVRDEPDEYLLVASSIGIASSAVNSQIGDIFKIPYRVIDTVILLEAAPNKAAPTKAPRRQPRSVARKRKAASATP